ncbi:MAG: hypothetical protein PHI40_07150, partial [Caldisericia bacterium]|nr:hypothetical protein [Caldisericia bacterium]
LQKNTPQTAEEELHIHHLRKDYNNLLQQLQNIENSKSKNEEDQSVLQQKLQKIERHIQEEKSKVLTNQEYASIVTHYEQCKEFQKQLSFLQQKEWESSVQSHVPVLPPKHILIILYSLLLVSLSSVALFQTVAIVRYIAYSAGLGSLLSLFYLLGFKQQGTSKSETMALKEKIEAYCKKHQIPLHSFENSDIKTLLTTWEETIQNHRDRIQAVTRWNESIIDIQSDLLRLDSQVEKINNQLADTKQKVTNIAQKWDTWKHTHQLLNQIEIHDAELLFSLIKDAQGKWASLGQYVERQALLKATIGDVQRQLKAVLDSLGENISKESLSAEYITSLQKRLADAEEAAHRKKELEIHIAQLQRNQTDIQERLHIKVEQYHSLLQSCQVSDMEDLEIQTKKYQSFQRVKEEQELLFHRLYGKVGNEEKWNITLQTLSKIDFQENEGSLQRCKASISSLENQANDAIEKRGKLQQKKEDVYSNTEMEYLQQQKESLENSLQEKAEEWLTYMVAYNLIQKTKSVFEEKQQPGVIRYASDWIYEITDHRYRLMKTSDSENSQESFVLYDTTDKRKTENEWSDGLADQVYLAIRIGLIHELSEHGETLPVFLDDIFVRFDAERQKRAAALLFEMSKKHQIFYFTCHNSILKLFQTVSQEIQNGSPSFYSINHFDLQPLSMEGSNENTVAALFNP